MRNPVAIVAITVVALAVVMSLTLLAQQNRYVTVPDGLRFSEFKGYDTWQTVSERKAGSSSNRFRPGSRVNGCRSHRRSRPNG
jgi:hypothetical protein